MFDFRESSVYVRDKNIKAARWREEGWYDMTIKTLFLKSVIETKASLDPNRQMGTLGGIFQSLRHEKKFMSVFQRRKNNNNNNVIITQVSFFFFKSHCRHWGGLTTKMLDPWFNKACVDVTAVWIYWGCAVVPRYWMRWSGGEVSLQLWSTPSWGVSWNHPSLHQGSLSKLRPFCLVQEMRSELLTTEVLFTLYLSPALLKNYIWKCDVVVFFFLLWCIRSSSWGGPATPDWNMWILTVCLAAWVFVRSPESLPHCCWSVASSLWLINSGEAEGLWVSLFTSRCLSSSLLA